MRLIGVQVAGGFDEAGRARVLVAGSAGLAWTLSTSGTLIVKGGLLARVDFLNGERCGSNSAKPGSWWWPTLSTKGLADVSGCQSALLAGPASKIRRLETAQRGLCGLTQQSDRHSELVFITTNAGQMPRAG